MLYPYCYYTEVYIWPPHDILHAIEYGSKQEVFTGLNKKNHFCSMTDTQYTVHPSAVVDENVAIGTSTKIWHFCHLAAGWKIGAGCTIGQNVYVDRGVIIGNRVKIQNNVSVYKGVTIEDNVFLGPSMVFTNVINPRSFIERKDEMKTTIVRKGATIGANATILCGTDVGSYALIGAGAVVTKDVPAYALLVGNPARQKGWVSREGHRLKFGADNLAVCPVTGERYKLQNEKVDLA